MATALIIGSNRGIGLELVRQLNARGDSVIAACRQSSAELDSIEGVRIETGVDMTSEESLQKLVDRLGPVKIDTLLVVAGILKRVSLDDLNVESIREQFEVNAIGPLRAVATLRGQLGQGAKVGLLTSRMGSIADNSSGGSYGYRMSKAALNMAGMSLAHDLKSDGVSVVLLHPGYVRTDMTGGTGHISAAEAATGLLKQVDQLTLNDSGQFVHQNGEALPW